jgi:metacaspase-1
VLNDARDVSAVLSSAEYCGYNPTQIRMLLDSEATLSAIRQALSDLAARCTADDTAFLFFSGHGARLTHNGTESSVLLPVDCRRDDPSGSTLSEAELSKALAAITAARLVVVLDACHSGGAASLKRSTTSELESGFAEKALARLAQGSGRVIIASSRATETSLVLRGARNSVFTERLLEALRGQAHTHGDGLIRIFEVFNYVSEKVRGTVPGQQHPIFKATDLEDNFPVALDKGGVKAMSPTASAASNVPRRLEDVMCDLYPAGPVDQEIWLRAGGDLSSLQLSGTGRALWFSALRKLLQGGGGQSITTHSLVRTALEDFPHHPELLTLRIDGR